MDDLIMLLQTKIGQLIVWPYLISFMFLSYLVKKYVQKWLTTFTRIKWKLVYTVLLLAAIISIPFLLFTDYGWEKILVTYTIGTSLHELFFTWVEKQLNRG